MAERHGGAAFEERARDGSSYRLRLVWHPLQAYDWYYNVVANPVLWFAQHYLWGLAESPDWDHGLHNAWQNGYVPVNANFADAVLDELGRQPDAAVFFHDYHLYVAPGLVRARAPEATLAHFVHIPWPQPDYWRVLPEEIRRAVHEGLLANDVVGFHTGRWRRNFLRSCEDIVGADVEFASSRGPLRRPGRPRDRPADLGRSGGVRGARRRASGVGRRGNDRCRSGRSTSSSASIAPTRRRTSYAGSAPTSSSSRRTRSCTAGADARAARPVAAGHSRVRRVPGRDPACGAHRERPLPARRLDPARPSDRRQLPAVGGRLQAVRRAARERDLRRHEPRRQGGAARERRATASSSCRRTPARTRSSASGRSRSTRSTSPARPTRFYRALVMPPGGAARGGSTASATRCASTTSAAGSTTSSTT